jgi:cytochrome oxidase Cu insertion factor (SCO1/SenC/PrrC family)
LSSFPPGLSTPRNQPDGIAIDMIRVQTFLFALAAAFALLAAGLAWYVAMDLPEQPAAGQVSTASIGGPFVLTDQNGHARSDRNFHGRFVLLYFGYSYCPDVCPTTLQDMANALAKLGPLASRVVPVFITVDPERDTPVVLKKYVGAFGPSFVGLTGSLADITRVAHAYRVYFAKHPAPGGGYSVDHSGTIYLLGPDGKLVTIYDASAGAGPLAADLKSRL